MNENNGSLLLTHHAELSALKVKTDGHDKVITQLADGVNKITTDISSTNTKLTKINDDMAALNTKIENLTFYKILRWWHIFSGIGAFLFCWYSSYLIALQPEDSKNPLVHFFSFFNSL